MSTSPGTALPKQKPIIIAPEGNTSIKLDFFMNVGPVGQPRDEWVAFPVIDTSIMSEPTQLNELRHLTRIGVIPRGDEVGHRKSLEEAADAIKGLLDEVPVDPKLQDKGIKVNRILVDKDG